MRFLDTTECYSAVRKEEIRPFATTRLGLDNVVAARGKVGGSGGRWRGLIHADGVRFDFRWWAHSAIYRSSIIERHT